MTWQEYVNEFCNLYNKAESRAGLVSNDIGLCPSLLSCSRLSDEATDDFQLKSNDHFDDLNMPSSLSKNGQSD